jgi:hypothetical protein
VCDWWNVGGSEKEESERALAGRGQVWLWTERGVSGSGKVWATKGEVIMVQKMRGTSLRRGGGWEGVEVLEVVDL